MFSSNDSPPLTVSSTSIATTTTTTRPDKLANEADRRTSEEVENLEPSEESHNLDQRSPRLRSDFSPFFTPPSPLSPSSTRFDLYNNNNTNTSTPPSSHLTPPSSLSFSPPTSSRRLAQTSSFDPVVGGGGGGGLVYTPSRSRVYTLKHSRQPREYASTSLPVTPVKPIPLASPSSNSSNLLPSNLALGNPPPTFHSSATWPPASLRSYPVENESPVKIETPTKKGGNVSEGQMLVSDSLGDTVVGEREEKEIATRYVLVSGFRKFSNEKEVETLLVHSFQHLSLKGCFTSRLAADGTVVLAFHDVRDAVTVVQQLDALQSTAIERSLAVKLRARCIKREDFEKLHDAHVPTHLLSRSEGVLVITVQNSTRSSSTSTPESFPLVSIYGEIRSRKTIDENLYLVEYFDDRAAEKAFKGLDGKNVEGKIYRCSFEPSVTSTESPPLPDLNLSSPSPPLEPSHSFRPFDPFSVTPPPLFSTRSTFSNSYTGGGGTLTFSPQSHFASPQGFPSNSLWPGADTSFPSYRLNPSASPSTSIDRDAFDRQGRFGSSSRNLDPFSSYGTVPLSPPFSPRARTDSFPRKPSPSSLPLTSNQPDHSHQTAQHSASGSGMGIGMGSKSRLPPTFGIVRDDRIPVGNVINYERIEQGLEVRTTLMLKNVPNKLKDVEVMQFIEEVVGRSFDFFYLRTDYATGCNVGYGFVNFTSMSALLGFCKQRLGTRWNMCNSDKLCVLSFANIQGKASLINHFKNSSVLDQDESRRPKLFVTDGPNAGEPEKFPVCDDPVRKMRSALNAANVGLFPSHKPTFKLARALQGMDL
ncbi:uncharacterized protein JCM6883_006627 [Sporobolomyces salmoneus]|uniref:uncharacterized protein n=1 Tax=Sporobolomyces salmoneus TaxID=183962 RepID=UPI00317EAB7C